jgi:hypothetical protein
VDRYEIPHDPYHLGTFGANHAPILCQD